MSSKTILSLCVIALGFAVSGIMAGITLAQTVSASDIQFPVASLGNCTSQTDCNAYCSDAAHADACVAFAEQHHLMSADEIAIAKKFLAAGSAGPGGCTSAASCQAYCDNISHIDECVAFAKKTGILQPEELKEAEQVQAAIAKGVQPPACGNKKECDAYCSSPSHMKECIAFGEAAGFLQGEELQNAKKMIAAIDAGATPPPCQGKDACDAYCSQPTHMEECITFAQAAGFMSPQEAADSQKVLAAIRNGVNPPKCQGKEACDAYCSQPEHFDECTNFAVAAGFMSSEDAAVAKKTGGKGPGGCTTKESCDAFCNNPDNQETCFNFAKDNGLISQDDLQKMQQGQEQLQQSLKNAPQAVLTCLQNAIGSDVLEKMKSGNFMPPKDVGEKMMQCFQQTAPQGQGPMNPQGQPGQNFAPGTESNIPGGPQGQAGPGGCTTPEECKKFCGNNPDACQNFQVPTGSGQIQSGGTMQPGQQFAPGTGPDDMQPNMMPQKQGESGERLKEVLPSKEFMPMQGDKPLNEFMPPPSGDKPPEVMKPPEDMQPMMQQDKVQPPTEQQLEDAPSSLNVSPAPLGSLLNVFAPLVGQH